MAWTMLVALLKVRHAIDGDAEGEPPLAKPAASTEDEAAPFLAPR
jgi:hypothetical protein